MRIPFIKMQGAGNDFVMIDAVRHPMEFPPELVRRLAHRQFGIGCDQMLVVEPSDEEGVDFRYRIFNQDGGEVEMCGNGARCFAVFVRAVGLTTKTRIRCRTMKGIIEPEVMPDGRVRVDMGCPRFAPEDIPMNVTGVSKLTRARDVLYQIRTESGDHWVSAVSMGNPHAVKIVGDVKTADVAGTGAEFQTHPAFPARVNVGFLEVVSRTEARLRVFERGVGETLACGSGACAAAVAGMRRGMLDSSVEIEMAGGRLRIEWGGEETQSVFLTGPAEIVFTGEIELNVSDA